MCKNILKERDYSIPLFVFLRWNEYKIVEWF